MLQQLRAKYFSRCLSRHVANAVIDKLDGLTDNVSFFLISKQQREEPLDERKSLGRSVSVLELYTQFSVTGRGNWARLGMVLFL